MTAGPLGGRWELGPSLGRGGTGEVYRAVDLHLRRRPAAVKLARQRRDRAARTALTQEAGFLSRLHHPGVVTVYDAGSIQDHPYLVIELVDGPTLQERLLREPLAPWESALLGEELARALAYVHQAGIAHCDLKPSNVLLDAHGRPHLADFGVARRMRDAPRRTRNDEITGTAAYLAPEQVRGAQPGPRADVYALGLVLTEALTGERTYEGAPLQAALARLQHPPEIPRHIPAEMADLLSQMTSGVPADRPTAGECAARLRTMPRNRLRTTGSTRHARPCAPPAADTSRRRRTAPSWIVLCTVIAAALCTALAVGALHAAT